MTKLQCPDIRPHHGAGLTAPDPLPDPPDPSLVDMLAPLGPGLTAAEHLTRAGRYLALADAQFTSGAAVPAALVFAQAHATLAAAMRAG